MICRHAPRGTTLKPSAPSGPEPPRNCTRCPRLVNYRETIHAQHPDWFGGAVPSFGGPKARVLILGLAPGKAGAHRTGRVFTGDASGHLLFQMLAAYGLSNHAFANTADDGLALRDCLITNVVRCVPPGNKPNGAEVTQCRPYLLSRLQTMANLQAILCLGRVAHDSLVRALDARLADHPFGHRQRHDLGPYSIFDSYHCSRYNLNTRRLTPQMFEAVFQDIRTFLDATNTPAGGTGKPPAPHV